MGPEEDREAEAFELLFTIIHHEILDNVLHRSYDVRCKVDRTDKHIKLTYPVKIDCFCDKFGYDRGRNKQSNTRAKPGNVLSIEANNNRVPAPAAREEHSTYQSIVGINNHYFMVQWN